MTKNPINIMTSDSLRIQKLTETNQKGKLEHKDVLIAHLEQLTGKDIDGKKPIIIIYHPGKDPCNSSGSATTTIMKAWTDELEKGTRRIAKTVPIYISKVPEELMERDKVRNWYEDKDQVIEKQFFNYHYPCYSYVIISTNGRYYSQFGEFGKESVWMMLRKMK